MTKKEHIEFYIPEHINPNVQFGGVLQLYLLAHALTKYSEKYFCASVRRECPELTWLPEHLRHLEYNFQSRPIDTIVIPEVCPLAINTFRYRPPNRILYAQAFAPEYLLAPLAHMSIKNYMTLGYTEVWAVSPFVAEKIREYELWDGDIRIVPNVFSEDWYKKVACNLLSGNRDFKKVLFSDRKGCRPFNNVVISNMSGSYKYTRLENMTEDEVIKEMVTSRAIVLNYKEEGFYRMALEAIQCGCIPIVYPAGGGEYFLKHKVNALVVDDPMDIREYLYLLKYVMSSDFFELEKNFDFSVDIPTSEVAIVKCIEGNTVWQTQL